MSGDGAWPCLHDLPGHLARHCLEIEKFCLHDLGLGQGLAIVLAVSGGADSTALAVIMKILATRQNWRLSVFSLDHGLRPEAVAEIANVQSLCRRLDLPCTVARADVSAFARENRLGLEEAGRKLRYSMLAGERQAKSADLVAIGHQKDDLCEDVLLRLTRGTGWPGLAGLSAIDWQRQLVRPLLATQRKILEDILAALGLEYCQDPSNLEPVFRRNRIRHQILPAIRQENPAFDSAIFTLWQLAREDAKYWQELLFAALAKDPWQESIVDGQTTLALPSSLLAGLPRAARLRLYLLAVQHLARLGKAGGQARAERLFALDKAWQDGRGNTVFQLPGGISARLKNRAVTFFCQNKQSKKL